MTAYDCDRSCREAGRELNGTQTVIVSLTETNSHFPKFAAHIKHLTVLSPSAIRPGTFRVENRAIVRAIELLVSVYLFSHN